MKFMEECVMSMEKEIFEKKKKKKKKDLYYWVNMGLPRWAWVEKTVHRMESLTEKEKFWA